MMKEQLFSGLIVLLTLLVLFSLYVTFWKAEERAEKQVVNPYLEKDFNVEPLDINTIQSPIHLPIKKDRLKRRIFPATQQKNISEFTTSQNTPEEMQEYTEDIYETLLPSAHEESIEEADEAFEVLDMHVKERSMQMQEHENISFGESYFTEEEQYHDEDKYEMELPYIEQ